MVEKTKIACPNCDKKISSKAIFCPKCGQKQGNTKVKMKDLLWKLWVTTVHLDSRVLRTFGRLFIPAQLTKDYFAGKQKKYFHPIQLFFLVLFFVFLSVSVFKNKKTNTQTFQAFQIFERIDAKYVTGQMDMRDSLRHYRDSLPPQWQTQDIRDAVDSLLSIPIPSAPTLTDSLSIGEHIPFTDTVYRFSQYDLLHQTPDSILNRYQINNWWDRLIIKQAIRSGLQSEEFNRFWAGTLSWSFLVVIAVVAFWLKLLYIRQKRYYVEHFLLILHLQVGLFATFIVALILKGGLHFPKAIALLILAWLFIGYFIGFKRYYQQSYLKTFIKFILFFVIYLFSFIVILLVSQGVAILFF